MQGTKGRQAESVRGRQRVEEVVDEAGSADYEEEEEDVDEAGSAEYEDGYDDEEGVEDGSASPVDSSEQVTYMTQQAVSVSLL